MSGRSESLPTHAAVRYLTPLREGGSLPAIIDTAEAGMFVAKFRGAGQGAKALISEVIVGLIALEIGLPVPEFGVIDMSEDFGRTEPDPEIQDILAGSRGPNFGIRYLDGAINFDSVAAADLVSEEFATKLVWLDAFLTNPDRSAKNPNLLVWGDRLWLIDHGAALFAHHNWSRVDDARTRSPFATIRQHVLLSRARDLGRVDATLAAKLDEDTLRGVLDQVPDSWLVDPLSGADFNSPEQARERYFSYLRTRLEEPRAFATEAQRASDEQLKASQSTLSARR